MPPPTQTPNENKTPNKSKTQTPNKSRANITALNRLLKPRHIAVLGGGWAEAVITACLDMGFEGQIWGVHPHKEKMAGLKTYQRIEDLPQPPDAVFLGINRKDSIDMVGKLAAIGAGGIVAFASGFAETQDQDGTKLQQDLVRAAKDMPLLGPNCYGFINYLDGAALWPDTHGGTRVTQGVAIITQSSNIALNITMQKNALPIAYLLTLGNQAALGMAELIQATAADDRITAIGLHIEGLKNAQAFADAVHLAKACRKPIVAIKVGASKAAQNMTISHTASMAGTHDVSLAFLKHIGVGLCNSIEELISTLSLLHLWGALEDASLLTLSCSGGEASLIADAALRHNIDMPPLTHDAAEKIKATVNPLVTVSNPFDYHTFDWGDKDRLTATFTAALHAGYGVNSLIIDFPSQKMGAEIGEGSGERISAAWQTALEAWATAQKTTGRIATVVSSMPESLSLEVAEWLVARKIVPMRGFDAALAAIASAHQAARPNPNSKSRLFGTNPLTATPAAPAAAPLTTLSETDAKALLAQSGIATPQGILTTSLVEAHAFEQKMHRQNKPIVMKISTAAHKTEHNGVILNIQGAEAVEDAWRRLHRTGGDIIKPILLEEMIDDGVAEAIVGVARDPIVGLYLIIGGGGVLAELLDDTKIVMIPSSRDDIEKALATTRLSRILNGFRGRPRANTKALIDLIMTIQDFAIKHHHRLSEMDINPIIVRPHNTNRGAVAVDALIRWADQDNPENTGENYD